MIVCCTNDCCGPGSYCCAHANPHTHEDCLAEYGDYVCKLGQGHVGNHLSGVTEWKN